jgi:hypothetical protein
MRQVKRCGVARLDCDAEAPSPASEAGPVQVICGSRLGTLRVWTEEEWESLSESERPIEYTHAPGMGWVGVVPDLCLN